MNNLLAKIKNDMGNLTCPNCKRSAIITLNGVNLSMDMDCPKEQHDTCYFYVQINNKLRIALGNNSKIKSFKRVDTKYQKLIKSLKKMIIILQPHQNL